MEASGVSCGDAASSTNAPRHCNSACSRGCYDCTHVMNAATSGIPEILLAVRLITGRRVTTVLAGFTSLYRTDLLFGDRSSVDSSAHLIVTDTNR